MLKVSDISIERGGRALIEKLSLCVTPGRITAVLGPNGAGKSSLLLALAGLLPPASGVILLNGRPLTSYSRREIAAHIAWQGALAPAEFGLTVTQRLQLAAGGREPDTTHGALDIAGLMDRNLDALSTGERQRVELAAVLTRDCPILLLDEPTAHLDLRHQCAWLGLMRVQARAGKAVVAVLHDIQQAVCVADDAVFVFGDGRSMCDDATLMLTAEKLEPLFGVSMLVLEDGACMLPDYGRRP